jgi:hypothetical protein
VQEALHKAVELFNAGRYAEFQDALDAMTSGTRAASERRFYTVLKNLAEAMLQLGDADVEEAATLFGAVARALEEFQPRFRGLNVAALRDDVHVLIGEARETRAGRRAEWAPSRLPRLRIVPQ